MADPPTGGPETPPINTQETTASFTEEDLEVRATTEDRRGTRRGDAFAPSDPAGRITTKEVWKLEIKHNQNVLQEQNEKLHEEVKALRAQIENAPPGTATRTWATVVANGGNGISPLSHQQPEKDQDCIRISTQRTFVDPRGNSNNDGNTFGRYLPIDAANNHIRTALQSDAATQDTQVAGIGTTKTGYIIRFKNAESAKMARNNTEWLQTLGNNTKLVKPRFGVVVHRTPTKEFDLEVGAVPATEKIINDNDLAEHGF
ncbi:hypothetical protein N7486_003874 [Penicillium sp. IBT 16267x]|nr:hypothetical protein N7486_003874 [Penicillium sp. IBT 16267x]